MNVNPYRYCGEYQDETTGLYYLRARYYDATTGRFTSADSYNGTTSDPVSLHKYLYAHANPVMNSDPTGYFTLFEMSVAMNVQNTLRDTYNSAIIDGFLNFLDTLLGGETDPTALLTSFASGVNTGLVTGALSSGISAMANLSCKLAKASSMLKMGMAGLGGLGSAYSTLQSVEDGNAQQAGFRFILTAVSGMGLKRSVGEGMATINSNCFIAGTLVLTEDGEKPIESIEVGDYVYSTDPETGESGYKEVLNVFVRQSNIIIHVFVNGEEIETTPTHPFWVEDEWITADKLKTGDILTLADGTTCTIDRIYAEFSDKAITVYNFEVADFHTYFVGDCAVLVHNAQYKPRLPKSNLISKVENRDGSITYTKKIGNQNISVTYSKEGYPDFSPYSHPKYSNPVEIDMTGNNYKDFKAANKAIGIQGANPPVGYTWHHLEDGKHMLLVKSDVHDATSGGFPHTGGASIVKK